MAEVLAENHADWLFPLLRRIYVEAFVHGFKHGKESSASQGPTEVEVRAILQKIDLIEDEFRDLHKALDVSAKIINELKGINQAQTAVENLGKPQGIPVKEAIPKGMAKCPECGKIMWPRGLGRHISQLHKGGAKKAQATIKAKAEPHKYDPVLAFLRNHPGLGIKEITQSLVEKKMRYTQVASALFDLRGLGLAENRAKKWYPVGTQEGMTGSSQDAKPLVVVTQPSVKSTPESLEAQVAMKVWDLFPKKGSVHIDSIISDMDREGYSEEMTRKAIQGLIDRKMVEVGYPSNLLRRVVQEEEKEEVDLSE